MRTPKQAIRAIGYTRVSTDRQGQSGLGLEAQTAAIHAAVEARGWTLAGIHTDVASGKSTDRRPELASTLTTLAAGDAQVLIVAKLDRLSRSLVDFASLMALAKEQGWSIVALDIGVDTSTLNGELVANIIMALAQWERQLIGQRVKAALDMTVERGTKLGRRSGVSPETVAAIVRQRTQGNSYREIAANLEAAGIPTAQAGTWRPSTVRKLYEGTT